MQEEGLDNEQGKKREESTNLSGENQNLNQDRSKNMFKNNHKDRGNRDKTSERKKDHISDDVITPDIDLDQNQESTNSKSRPDRKERNIQNNRSEKKHRDTPQKFIENSPESVRSDSFVEKQITNRESNKENQSFRNLSKNSGNQRDNDSNNSKKDLRESNKSKQSPVREIEKSSFLEEEYLNRKKQNQNREERENQHNKFRSKESKTSDDSNSGKSSGRDRTLGKRAGESKFSKRLEDNRPTYIREPREPRLTLGITVGDVNGIGPELLLEVFSDSRMLDLANVVIYGPLRAINYYKQILRYENFHFKVYDGEIFKDKINWVDTTPNFDRVEVGFSSSKAGYAAFQALEIATQHLIEGEINVLVTLPIDKASIQNPNFAFPGHTEYLADRFGENDALMLMVCDELRIAVVTGHIPIKEVSEALSVEKILRKISLFHGSLQLDFNIQKPKIAVLGLNPHAGDNGLLGNEENEMINVAIDRARADGMLITGALAADGFFATSKYLQFDGILAMYHDQGLIPFKTLAQGSGVNFTAGLTCVRTSPDHGVAYDIAGKSVADTTSLREAIYLALDIYRIRVDNINLINGAIKNVRIRDFVEAEDSIVSEGE